jgi:alanine dehydrogenase
VPISSTRALTNATLPYLELVADRGFERAIAAAPALARGVSVLAGHVTSQPVAEALGYPFVPLAELVGTAA